MWKRFLLLFAFGMALNPLAAQTFGWAFPLGFGVTTRVMDVKEDQLGNLVVGGTFSDSIDLDPSPQVYMLHSDAALFLAKYTPSGAFLWGFVLDSNSLGTCQMTRLQIDNQNQIYVFGYLSQDTVDMDPGPGNYPLASNNQSGFLAKYSASGQLLWAFSLLGNQSQQNSVIQDMAVGADGNLYLCGWFTQTIDFDPGLGSFLLTANPRDAFVAKYSPTGNFIWAFPLGSQESPENLTSIETDSSNHVYLAGSLTGLVDADPGQSLFQVGYPNRKYSFFAKYTPQGDLVWAKSLPPSYQGSVEEVKDLVLDSAQNLYLTGTFLNKTEFDPNGPVSLQASNPAGFLAKYNAQGNYLWAFKLEGSAYGTIPSAIRISPPLPTTPTIPLPQNILYVVGSAAGPIDFDPGPGTFSIPPLGTNDAFVALYSSDAVLFCAYTISGDNPYFQMARSVHVSNNGNYFVCGEFGDGTANFYPYFGPQNISTQGITDGFLAKYFLDTAAACYTHITGVPETLNPPSFYAFPNPSPGSIFLSTNAQSGSSLRIFDAQGKCIREFLYLPETAIHLPGPGMFLVELISNKEVQRCKVIVH